MVDVILLPCIKLHVFCRFASEMSAHPRKREQDSLFAQMFAISCVVGICILSELLVLQADGVIYIRIEHTQKRKQQL